MDPLEIVRRRLRAQRLVGEPLPGPAQVVAALGAVQAQEFAEAKWALAQRSGHPRDEEVEQAFAAGEFLRTHVLRPTWHFVAPEDIGWMARLTAPRIRAASRSAYQRDGLDDELLRRCDAAVMAALEDGEPLTRRELGAALAEAGIEFEGNGLAHAVMRAEIGGLICSGPRRGAQHTYVPVAQRARRGTELEGDEALAELASRYFSTHGPATVADFAWWSGLTVREARRGRELCGDRFEEVAELDGSVYYGPPDTDGGPVGGALMLGWFDEALVAYRDLRTVSAAGEPGRALIQRPILLDGRLVGTWRRKLADGTVRVEASVAAAMDGAGESAIEGEARRFAAHLGRELELELSEGGPVAAA